MGCSSKGKFKKERNYKNATTEKSFDIKKKKKGKKSINQIDLN